MINVTRNDHVRNDDYINKLYMEVKLKSMKICVSKQKLLANVKIRVI